MSITLSFQVTNEKIFVLASSTASTVAGVAEVMKKIFEIKKIFDQRTNKGAIPSWAEFSAVITVADHATNFHLRLTSQNNEFIYNLKMMTPKTAETLVSSEELKKLRTPLSAQPPPPQSASVSYHQELNARLNEQSVNPPTECAPSPRQLPAPLTPLPSSTPNSTNSDSIAPHPTTKRPSRNIKESFISQLYRFFSSYAYQLFCGLNRGFKWAVSFLFKTGVDAPNGRWGS
jgi:hypothetical protein